MQESDAQNSNSDSIVSLTKEGINFIEAGEPEKAIRSLSNALKKDSIFWESYYLKAIAFTYNEQAKEAVNDFQKSISIHLSGSAKFPDTLITNSLLKSRPFGQKGERRSLDENPSLQLWQKYLIQGVWEFIVSNGKNHTDACELWLNANYLESLQSISSLNKSYCK